MNKNIFGMITKHKRLRSGILVFFMLGIVSLYGQKETSLIKIKCEYDDTPLSLIFFDLKINDRLQFEYNKEDIEGIRLTRFLPKMPLDEALELLLQGTGLTFEITAPRKINVFIDPNFGKSDLAPSEFVAENFDFTITGKISDIDNGESLPYATILVKGTSIGTSSNGDGYFTIENIPSDTSLLEIQYLGYHTEHFRLTPENAKNELKITMNIIGQTLGEVIIIAEKEEQLLKASTGISKIGLTPEAVATLPSFGEKDIFRSLQLLPGVSGSNESSSGLYVRGGTPDQNLVLFDDFTVYHVDHLLGFFSAFNSNAIKNVQFHKGGFGAKYGGRLSSVVELTGKDGNSEQFNAGFGLSLLSTNAFVEAPFAEGKGSFLVAGRRSFQSNFYGNIFDSFTGGDDTENNTGLGSGPPGGRFGQQEVEPNSHFYDLNAKTTYRPSSKDIVSLSFYNGQDNLDNSRNSDASAFGNGPVNLNFQRENTDLTKWGNWGAAAKWSRRWNNNFYSNLNFSYSNYYSERNQSNRTTIVRDDSTFTLGNGNYEYNNLKDYSFKMDNEWKLSLENQLEFGLQLTHNDIEYKYIQNDTLTILNRLDKGNTNSIYIQDKHTFGQKLILSGGLRATHYSVNSKSYIEPRASLTYLLNDHIKLKGAWGKYYQFATRIVREDIQQGSRDFWLLANDETVPVGSSTHYIAGASYETPVYLFDVEAYVKELDGLSEYTTRFTPSGFGPNSSLDYEEFFYTGNGLAKGVEFLVQKKTGQFTGWAGYTLSEVKYDFDAFGEDPFYANQDQTHELKLVGNYKLNKWTIGASFIYATNRPYTAPTGYYEVDLLDGNTANFFEVSDKNTFRLPNYHRFDISGTYNFNMGLSKGSFGISVYNVYDRNNVWYKEYEVIEGELLETSVSLLGITPSLFFNWTIR